MFHVGGEQIDFEVTQAVCKDWLIMSVIQALVFEKTNSAMYCSVCAIFIKYWTRSTLFVVYRQGSCLLFIDGVLVCCL